MSEASAVYYGLQYLIDKELPEKLFIRRAGCVPPEEWTLPIWQEAARLVARYHKQLRPVLGEDPMAYDIVTQMAHQMPVTEALDDARSLSPRPSSWQISAAQALARRFAEGQVRLQYNVTLADEHGFAKLLITDDVVDVVPRLPGYDEESATCWLSDALAAKIADGTLSAAPDVMGAINTELGRIQHGAPYALFLEDASSCESPDDFPAVLLAKLQGLHPNGLTVH